jgi:hypothetical protein
LRTAGDGDDTRRMSVHQCPECELRFSDEPELRDHLDTDHPGAIGEHLPHPGPHADWPHNG